MTVLYAYNGSIARVVEQNDSTTFEKLPAEVFRVKFDPFSGYFLSKVTDRFEIPSKIYGKSSFKTDTILQTYASSNKQLGVILSGTKGAGKTLFSQILCNEVMDECNIPTILVDQPYCDQSFFDFMKNLKETIVVFDEFAKVYQEDQQQMLTFFDGNNSTKRLSIVIENGIDDVNEFMINRPSRFMFRIEYDNIPKDVITEMCVDKGVSPQKTKEINSYVQSCLLFSNDMLSALIKQVTEMDMSVSDAISLLNIPSQSTFTFGRRYDILDCYELTADGPVKAYSHADQVVESDSYISFQFMSEKTANEVIKKAKQAFNLQTDGAKLEDYIQSRLDNCREIYCQIYKDSECVFTNESNGLTYAFDDEYNVCVVYKKNTEVQSVSMEDIAKMIDEKRL